MPTKRASEDNELRLEVTQEVMQEALLEYARNKLNVHGTCRFRFETYCSIVKIGDSDAFFAVILTPLTNVVAMPRRGKKNDET